MDDDPLTWTGKVRCRVGVAFKDVTDKFMAGSLEDVTTPFIVFHGVHDTFTDPLGSETLYQKARATDKTHVKVGPGQDLDVEIWHNMTNEPGCELVLERTLAWLAAKLR
jgi:alpha-beta hydrolase superfamily lysophospholipase